MEAGDAVSLTVQRIAQVMEQLAPKHLAEEWDNVGLQLGESQKPVSRVMVTLTVTPALVQRAIAERTHIIVAHHPLIFRPLQRIRTDSPGGRMIADLIKNDIAVYVSHTNLDHAANGLNTWLAEDLGLEAASVLQPWDDTLETGLGRVGLCDPITVRELAEQLASRWNTTVRYCGRPDSICKRIAVCGGAGGKLVGRAFASGADVLITGDVGYHEALEAEQLGLAVIDAGHFATEQLMLDFVTKHLTQEMGEDGITIVKGHDGDNPWQTL